MTIADDAKGRAVYFETASSIVRTWSIWPCVLVIAAYADTNRHRGKKAMTRLIDRAIPCQPHNLLAKLIGDIVGVGGRLDA